MKASTVYEWCLHFFDHRNFDGVKTDKANIEIFLLILLSFHFQANSSALLSQVENAILEVKEGIDSMAHARTNLGNATEIASEVLGMTISVTEQTIHDISQDILSKEVDQALVNDTLKNASAGLKIAEEAQRLAERAMYVKATELHNIIWIECFVPCRFPWNLSPILY